MSRLQRPLPKIRPLRQPTARQKHAVRPPLENNSPANRKRIVSRKPPLVLEKESAANSNHGSRDVVLVVEGEEIECSAFDLRSKTGPLERIQTATSIEFAELESLVTWPSSSRLLLLACLARRQEVLGISVGDARYTSVLTAVLAATPKARDAATLNSWLAMAIEAVAAEFGDQGDIALGQIRTEFAQRGVRELRIGDLRRRLKTVLDAVTRPGPGTVAEARPLPAEYAESLALENLVVPSGWEFGDDGMRLPSSQRGGKLEFPTPVLVGNILEATGGIGEVRLTIKWRDRGTWRSADVERKVIANARSIVELAGQGLPVTSNNAAALVQFLSDFELANANVLPRRHGSSVFGWHQTDKVDGFLLGNKYLVAKEQADQTTGVVFHGVDEGDQQLINCFGKRGSFAEWQKTLQPLEDFPKARLVLYAAFAPVMMRILGATNFLLEVVAPTTKGKSIALRIGASVWGDPDESAANAFLRTFDGTRTWFERIAAVMRDVPLMVDETKHIDAQLAGVLIYDLAQGRGKGRGTIKGLAKQVTSRTITILSGEQPIVSATKSGGAAARVLSLTGSPFGEVSSRMADVVRRLNDGVKANFGFAGVRFVRFVLNSFARHAEWRHRFDKLVREFERRSPDGNEFAIRIAPHLALLQLTAELVHEAGMLPWDRSDPIGPVYGDIVASLHAADSPKRALRFAIEWATSHQAEFFRRRSDASSTPATGWMGRWNQSVTDQNELIVPGQTGHEGNAEWDCLAYLPLRLEKLLKDNGFDYEAVLPVWEERGWLIATVEKRQKRFRKRCRIGAENVWTIAIPRSVINKFMSR